MTKTLSNTGLEWLVVWWGLWFSPTIATAVDYDVILRGGELYDGSGGPSYIADIGIDDGRIAFIGDLAESRANRMVDVSGLAVAPGFINMLSWANWTLIEDGRGVSDVIQGVTLEVFGEGWTMGPWNERMKREFKSEGGLEAIPWTTLGEYLEFLESKGISPNVASLVGADTLRNHVIGYEDRAPTNAELKQMQELARTAMREGALGVGSALLYTPGSYASIDELTALASVAGEYGGLYASHVRSLGEDLLKGIGELMIIARDANLRAHVYHLIAAGKANWKRLDNAIALIEGARQRGLEITSDMHPYTRAGTNLNITTPPWTRDGGDEAFVSRLRDPTLRDRIRREMLDGDAEWDNAYTWAGPSGIVLAGITHPEFKQFEGKTIPEISRYMGVSNEDAVLDLLIAGKGNAYALYHLYSEENVRKKVGLPWLAFMSDSPTFDAHGPTFERTVHPRAYGTFARILGKYVRQQKLLTLSDAVRRLTAYPAELLGIRLRGQLRQGYWADIAIFNPRQIIDKATFEQPHQLAEGMVYVLVNGKFVVSEGEHTGLKPGRVVRGPGWVGW